MSGVLFVVHIPSEETEQKLRDNKKEAVIVEENEKEGDSERRSRSTSEHTTPLTTPEMQRYGTFLQVSLFYRLCRKTDDIL